MGLPDSSTAGSIAAASLARREHFSTAMHFHHNDDSPDRTWAACATERDALVPMLGVLLTIAVIGSEPLRALLPYAFYIPLIMAFVMVRERSVGESLGRIAPLLPVILVLALGLPLSRFLDTWLAPHGLGGASSSDLPLLHDSAWTEAASLFMRAGCALILVSSLVANTGFPRILVGLRRLGLPVAVVLTLQHMERYRALIAEEWRRTNLARESRSPGGLRFAFASYANQTSLVFLRSWERSERIHAAMLSRGFSIDAMRVAANQESHEGTTKDLLSHAWLPVFALLIRLAV